MIRHGSDDNVPPALDDNVLKQMYIEYDTPCDSLVSDREKLVAFAEIYADRTSQAIEPTAIARRLLSLRKRGQGKGGLPRIRRRTHHGS